MRYAKVVNGVVVGYPMSDTDVVRANSNTSFPRGALPRGVVEALGYVAVQDTPQPNHDSNTHVAVEGRPALADGGLVQTWEIRELTAEELAARVPQEVSALQALQALDMAGLSEVYEAWATHRSRTFLERAFITRAQVWRRGDPLLIAASAAIGLTAEQLDSLFVLAAEIE